MPVEFSQAVLRQVDEIVARYPDRQAALLPVLHIAQQAFGYVSPEAMIYVGELLGVPPVKVREVATFYTMYNKTPVGRFHVQVCTNMACMLGGGEAIFQHLKGSLGVENKGTTADGLFTLEEVECLAGCDKATVVQVNDRDDRDTPIRYHEGLRTTDDADRLIDLLRDKAGGEAPA